MAAQKKNVHQEMVEKHREERRQKAVSAAAVLLAGGNPGEQWELSQDKDAITLKHPRGPRVYSLAKYKDSIEAKVSELREKKKAETAVVAEVPATPAV